MERSDPEPERGGGRAAPTLPEARELTRARARDLRALISKYIRRYLPRTTAAPPAPPEPPRIAGAYARLLPFLQLIPWALGLVFAFSFFWDFPGAALALPGRAVPLEGILRIISVSGLIGFFTNWLAITMLFNPRERRPLLGQGLIPSQRERVIFRLAKAVSEELINEKIIKQRIEESGIISKYRELAMSVTRGIVEDPEFRMELKALTAEYVDTVLSSQEVRDRIVAFTVEKVEEYAGQGLGGLALKTYRFLNEPDFQRRVDEAVRRLPTSLDLALDGLDHLLDRVPDKIEARSEEIEVWVTRAVLGFVEKIDVYEMVVANMKRYDERQLEALLKNTSNEQLNYIKYLGGVLGCIGGLVIWQPLLALAALSGIGLTIYGIDEALFRGARR
jgi:hypothetical protein